MFLKRRFLHYQALVFHVFGDSSLHNHTGFIARYESNKEGPAIGFLAEYDSLPGLGHACGL
jgi:metal-dependent amidase/aminoacylase/carboxypeptidase family protein